LSLLLLLLFLGAFQRNAFLFLSQSLIIISTFYPHLIHSFIFFFFLLMSFKDERFTDGAPLAPDDTHYVLAFPIVRADGELTGMS